MNLLSTGSFSTDLALHAIMSHPPSRNIVPPYNVTNFSQFFIELNSIFESVTPISKYSFVLQYVGIHTTLTKFMSHFSWKMFILIKKHSV